MQTPTAARRASPLLSLSLALAAASGCAGNTSSSSDDTVHENIVGGTRDSGHPAVAAILLFDLQTYCSASLVGPRALLTAGHCVNAATELADYSAVFGRNDEGDSIEITRQVVHPNFTDAGKAFDIGLMQLRTAPAGVTPMRFAKQPLAQVKSGTMITHVGFGATEDQNLLTAGTKHILTMSITRVDAHFVYSGTNEKNTADGDSGGPGLIVDADGQETIVSVVSDGPTAAGEGWDDRVDEVSGWIESTIAGW